jgi:hypothetical protein
MAAAMVTGTDEPVGLAQERIGWAAERTWDRRTDAWLDATLGPRPVGVTGELSRLPSHDLADRSSIADVRSVALVCPA